jgi:hypothetical protein
MNTQIECEFCGNPFKNKYSLRTHQKTVKSCIKIQEELGINTQDNQQNYTCHSCSKQFNIKSNYIYHIENCKITKPKYNEISKALVEKEKENIRLLTLLQSYQEQNKKLEEKVLEYTTLALKRYKPRNTNHNLLVDNIQPDTAVTTNTTNNTTTNTDSNNTTNNNTTNNNTTNNTIIQNNYKIELNKEFASLPQFTKENVLAKFQEFVTDQSVQNADTFVSDTTRAITPFIIIVDASRNMSILKNNKGKKEKTNTEVVHRKSLAYCYEHLDDLIGSSRKVIEESNDLDYTLEDKCKRLNTITQVKRAINSSKKDKTHKLSTRAGNKITKDGKLICKE